MNEERISESELIIHPDGSIYHLHLHPEQLADTVITVGDPKRVEEVSKHFDRIEHRVSYREFITNTGWLNNKRLTVMSTGMGTDNIDIAMNELDALANIDFKERRRKDEVKSLEIIRLGTSGSVCEEVNNDDILITEIAIGLDGLLHYYRRDETIHETVYREAFANHLKPHFAYMPPYIALADETLLQRFEPFFKKGTTVTAGGFYAPQGRRLRTENTFPDFIEVMNSFRHKHFRITNIEMETAGIYGMGKVLGHKCLSVNAILANRITGTFSNDHKKTVDRMIEKSLEIITER